MTQFTGPLDNFLTLALLTIFGVWVHAEGGLSTIFMVCAAGTLAMISCVHPVAMWVGSKRGLGAIQANKSREQWWQLIVHISMTALNAGIFLFADNEDGLWTTTPHAVDARVSLVYKVQAAIWFVTAFRHRFYGMDSRNKDYVLMYVHHIVTLLLIVWSYANDWNCHRGGAYVMFLHDASDIVIDVLRLSHNLKLDADAGLYFAEISFATNFATWAYFRLYRFPLFIYSSWNAEINVLHSALSLTCVVLLIMHVYWYYLFGRIAVKLALGVDHHKAGEDYEGADDGGDGGSSGGGALKKKKSSKKSGKLPKKSQ